MGLNNIEKKTLGYRILWQKMRFWHNHIYYRDFTVIGKENIPVGKPMIFTPNHQNALMDALALLFSFDIIFVFLARADIFKKPKIASILYFLKILPIYRERDGSDFKERSNEIFKRTVDIITNGAAMVILPEGNHSRLRRLRTLKKGFARMAFQTEEANNFEMDIQIVPVGIDYDNFFNYRSSLVVSFGKPVPVSKFVGLYKDNQALALNEIRDALSSEMAQLIPNIQSEEYYEMYNELRVLYRKQVGEKTGMDAKNPKNRVKLDQIIISHIEEAEKTSPETVATLNTMVTNYLLLRNKLGYTNYILEKKGSCFFSLLVGTLSLIGTLPILLVGTLVNIIPYSLPIWVAGKMKDEQFRSSVKFVLSALAFPIFYILQTLVVGLLTNWEYALLFLVSIPITGAVAWKWTRIYLWLIQGWKYLFNRIRNTEDHRTLTRIYEQIISKMDKITK